MRSNTLLVLTVLVAALVLNCSKFAIGGSETAGILTDAQLAPLVIDTDEVMLSLHRQARAAMADVHANPEL
jgi:hypothetical protein